MDITQLPGLSGWPGLVVTLFAMIIYGWYTRKSVKSQVEDARKETTKQAEDVAKQANQEAIAAMQTHINILRERMKDSEEDNTRMKHEMEAIYAAFKARGIYITIDGKMVHIVDNKGNSSTTIHINDSVKEEELS
jgi:seryl-tRNA synthetase